MQTGHFNLMCLIFPIFLLCSLGVGCSGSGIRTIVHENPKSTIYLEWVQEESFRATHPAFLSPTIIQRSLEGIMVQEPKGIMDGVLGQEPKVLSMFSDEDMDSLVPYLVSALSRATPEEHVVFQKKDGLGSDVVKIAGTLHIQENLLVLTLTNYRNIKTRPTLTLYRGNRQIHDSSGLKDMKLSFNPKSAWQNNLGKNQKGLGRPSGSTLVIDYKLLANLAPDRTDSHPPFVSEDKASGPKSQPNQGNFENHGEIDATTKGSKKDRDLKGLEEKLRFLSQELMEVKDEIDRLKNNP